MSRHLLWSLLSVCVALPACVTMPTRPDNSVALQQDYVAPDQEAQMAGGNTSLSHAWYASAQDHEGSFRSPTSAGAGQRFQQMSQGFRPYSQLSRPNPEAVFHKPTPLWTGSSGAKSMGALTAGSPFDASSYTQKNISACPSIAKMAERIRKPAEVTACVRNSSRALGISDKDPTVSFYNAAMLEVIPTIPSGGGYEYLDEDLVAPGGINVATDIAPGLSFKGSAKASHCLGAVNLYLLKGFKNIDDKFFRGAIFRRLASNTKQLKNFSLGGTFTQVLSSNNWSVNDANNYAKFGVNFGKNKANLACAGDSMLLDRANGTGHSGVFLGFEDGGKNMYYWSSNKDTDGFGISCIATDKIADLHFTRPTSPGNLVNIPESGSQPASKYIVNQKNAIYQGTPPIVQFQPQSAYSFGGAMFADTLGVHAPGNGI